jgi:hypothetical protein
MKGSLGKIKVPCSTEYILLLEQSKISCNINISQNYFNHISNLKSEANQKILPRRGVTTL